MALLKSNHINKIYLMEQCVSFFFFKLDALLTWLAGRPHKCKVPIQEEHHFQSRIHKDAIPEILVDRNKLCGLKRIRSLIRIRMVILGL